MEKYPHIILAHSKKGERYILTHSHGYLSAHWESTPTHHQIIKRVWDLEIVKSNLLNHGAIIDWDSYQWMLNKFEELKKDSRSPADIIAQSLKETLEAAAYGIRKFAEAFSGFKGKR